jgi:hypothetical protein
MTIGRKGSGPGEFSGTLNLAFDNNNSLCVYDFGNQRLSKFSHDGRYIRSINLGADHIPAGLTLDASDKIYISAYDHKRENVIHKYSADGELIISFGEPVNFKEPIRFADMTVKSNISAGPIALIDNEIYYSQRNPYEIRRFTTEGELKTRIFRKNSFMPPSQIKIVRRETYQFRPPAMSVFITVWRDRIINWVWIPEYISLSTGSIIDLFDLNGHLLATLTIPDRVGVSYLDTQGKIYGIHRDREGIERVVRYVFKF